MAVNRTDAGMQQLINMFGDCTRIKKLWTNASLGSEFPAQTIKVDLSSYQFVIISFKLGSGFEVMSISKVGTNGMIGSPNENVNATNANYVRRYIVSKDNINFGDGYFNSKVYNIYTKPVEIYGVKGVK